MTYELHHGDCVEVMRSLPAESVDAIVTSPPYAEQRKTTYGGIPENDYPGWTVAWMTEARRLLKPDGSVIINIRPHIKAGQISDYVLRTRIALRDAGWNECEELIWFKPTSAPMGSKQRPRRSWESLHWFAKHGRPYVDAKASGRPSVHLGFNESRTSRNGQWGKSGGFNNDLYSGTARCQDVARIGVHQHEKGSDLTDHPAPFPWQLAEWCGRLICPPGGVALDPFNGSASTGVAAIRNGWDYIGIDAVQEYIDMSEQRLLHVTQQMEQEAS